MATLSRRACAAAAHSSLLIIRIPPLPDQIRIRHDTTYIPFTNTHINPIRLLRKGKRKITPKKIYVGGGGKSGNKKFFHRPFSLPHVCAINKVPTTEEFAQIQNLIIYKIVFLYFSMLNQCTYKLKKKHICENLAPDRRPLPPTNGPHFSH